MLFVMNSIRSASRLVQQVLTLEAYVDIGIRGTTNYAGEKGLALSFASNTTLETFEIGTRAILGASD